jgi:hypothetical protein
MSRNEVPSLNLGIPVSNPGDGTSFLDGQHCQTNKKKKSTVVFQIKLELEWSQKSFLSISAQ